MSGPLQAVQLGTHAAHLAKSNIAHLLCHMECLDLVNLAVLFSMHSPNDAALQQSTCGAFAAEASEGA